VLIEGNEASDYARLRSGRGIADRAGDERDREKI
jgi:hypothetical protein